MPKAAPKPFDIKLKPDEMDDLGLWLSHEIETALAAKGSIDRDVMYFHALYEQGRTRVGNEPWSDAADLTSAIGTEKVDSLRARIAQVIFTDQVWTVEGWGEAGPKAPFVEEFHQWQQETEGFQAAFMRAVHLSLIEPRGVLEIYEDRMRRPVRKVIKAALQVNPADGSPMVGPDLEPLLQQDEAGRYAEVHDELTPSAETEIDSFELVCNGPRHRTIASRDFLVLPGHAQDRSEVWGSAKRFYRTVRDLQERAKQGVYDEVAVADLGDSDERQSNSTSLSGEPQASAQAHAMELAEKELWELTFLKDLDGKGLRWWVATVHLTTRAILRIQYDDIGRPRYFPLVPFPKPNTTEGYSFIGNKLITVIEEDTAWRNMLADRGSVQLNAPMKVLVGALWNPDDTPIGPKAVIYVRDMNEVQAMELPDYTSPAIERIQDCDRRAERIAGITDVASGVTPTEDRTLGETQLVTQQSFVRMSEVIKNLQEPMEDIAQVRHLMWQRALQDQAEQGPLIPGSVLKGLETRGADVTQYTQNPRVTAEMLEGAFKFKPKGSVESADRNMERKLFAQGMQGLASLSQANPMIGMIIAQPQAAKALLEQWVRLYGQNDKQAFLGQEVWGMAQAQMQQQQAMMQAQSIMGAGGEPAPSQNAQPGPEAILG